MRIRIEFPQCSLLLALVLSWAIAATPVAAADRPTRPERRNVASQDTASAAGPASQPASQEVEVGRRPWDPTSFLARSRALFDDIDLTEEQKQKIDDLFKEAGDDLRDMQQHSPPTERVARAREYLATLRDKVNSLLTEEQKKTLKQKLTTVQAGARMLDQLRQSMSELDLSDQQRQTVEMLTAKAKDRIEALRGETDPDALRDRVRVIGQEFAEGIQKVLTDEQRRKLRELMQKLREERNPAATTQSS